MKRLSGPGEEGGAKGGYRKTEKGQAKGGIGTGFERRCAATEEARVEAGSKEGRPRMPGSFLVNGVRDMIARFGRMGKVVIDM